MTSITTPRRSQSGDGHDSLPPLGDPQQQQQQQQQHREDAHGGGRTLVSSTGSVHAWPERPHTARNPNGPPAANDDEADDFAVERKKVHISDDAESHGRQHRAWTAQSVRGRERTYDVNLVTTHMPLYEPLLDEYLADYFNSPKIRQHLQKLGLVDAEGNIIDAKRFKYNQIRLDQAQYQANIMKRMEELDFDREIEVAIRRQNELEKAPRSHKLRKAVESAPSTLPYPEFLANYPATMTRTALLYAEKPASLTKAEEMLVAKLRQQAPRKLKALGLTPELLSGKEQHARNEARRDRKLLWKAGSSSRQASAGSARAPPGAGKRPTTAAPGSRRNNQRELVVHDDLSGDEWEGLEGHEVTTGAGGSRGPKQLHEQDSVTNLFEIAKRQYQSGNIDDAETQVRRILQRVGRPGTAAATAGDENNGTSKASIAGSTPPRTAPASAATTRPTSAAVAKLRSGRSTPRHRSLRPKSARPTRESHFPIASDFSDFDAGSEGGYESDGEVNLSEDQAMDNQGIVNVIVGSEPIAENEEVIQAVIEQTQVETPSAEDGNQEEKQLGGTGENEHAENQEPEPQRNEQAHDAQPAHQQPSHDGYDADFEGTDTSQAPAEKSAPTDDDYEADFDQDQLPPMTASVSNPAVSQHKSHSIAKFWDVESVDAVVEQSGPAYPRTTENSSFDVMAGNDNRSKPGSKHGSGIVAAVSHAVHKITHRGSKEAIDANHDHENSEELAPTERHRSSPLLQHDQSDEQQHQSQPHKPQHTLSSPLLRDGSHTAVVAGGPSAQRLNSPAGSVKNSPAGSIKNVARVAVSSPLAKSSIAKSSPSLGHAPAGKSNSATADAAAAGTVPLPPSVAQSTANISGTRPGTAAHSTANVNRAGASRQVLKSTPNLAAEKGVAAHTVTTVSGIDPDSNNAKSTTSVALQKNAAQSASALGRRSDSFEKAAGEQLPPSVAASVANVTDGKTSPRSTANLKSAAPSTNNIALQKNAAKSASALGRRSDSFENAARQPLPPSVAASVANVADGKANARSAANLKSASQSTRNVAYEEPEQESRTPPVRPAQSAPDVLAENGIDYAAAQPLPPSAFQSIANVTENAKNARSTTNLKSAAGQSSPALQRGTSAKSVDAAAAVPLPASTAQSVANVANDPARSRNNLQSHAARSAADLQDGEAAAKAQLKKSAQSTPNVTAAHANDIDRAAAEPLPPSVAASTANVTRGGVSGSVRFASQSELLDRHGARSSSPTIKKGKDSAQSSPNVLADGGNGSLDIDRAAAMVLPPSAMPSTVNMANSSPKMSRSIKTPFQSSPNLRGSALDRAAAQALPPSAAPSVGNVATAGAGAARSSADVRGSQNALSAKGNKAAAAQSSPNVQRSTTALDRAAAQALPESVAPSLAYGLDQNARSSPDVLSDHTAKQSSPALNKSRATLQSRSSVAELGAPTVDRIANIPLPASVAPSLATGLDQISLEARKSTPALAKTGGGKSTPALHASMQEAANTGVDRAANVPLPASVAPSLATGLDQTHHEARKSNPALAKTGGGKSTPALHASMQEAANTGVDLAANVPLPASVAPSLATGLDQTHHEARKSNPALAKTSGGKSAPALHASSQEAAIPAVDRAANVPLPASVAPSLATGLNRDGKSTPSLEKSAAKSTPALNNTAGATVDRVAKIPLPASVAPSLATGLDGAREAPNHQSHAAGISTTAVGLGARAPSSSSISKLVGRTAGNKIPDAGSLAEMRKVGSVEIAGVAPEDVAGTESVVRAEEQHGVGQHDAHDSTASATVPAAKSSSNADIWADIRQPVDHDSNTRTEQAAAASSLARTNSGLKSHGSNNKLVDPPQLPGKPTAEAHKTGGGSKPASRSGSKLNLVKEAATGGGGKKTGSRPVSRSQSQRSLNAHGVSPAPVKA